MPPSHDGYYVFLCLALPQLGQFIDKCLVWLVFAIVANLQPILDASRTHRTFAFFAFFPIRRNPAGADDFLEVTVVLRAATDCTRYGILLAVVDGGARTI